MRQGADLSKRLVIRRRLKKLKRLEKAGRALKVLKVKGLGFIPSALGPRWEGLKPKRIEGFVVSLRGIPMTKDGPFKKIYPEYENKRVRMQ